MPTYQRSDTRTHRAKDQDEEPPLAFPLPDFLPLDRRLLLEDDAGKSRESLTRFWLLRWAKCHTGRVEVQLPYFVAHQLIDGDGRHWASDPTHPCLVGLDCGSYDHVSTPRGPNGEFVCPPGCPLQQGCRRHQPVSSIETLLGAAEHCRVVLPDGTNGYAIPPLGITPAELVARGWSEASAAAYGPVFLPVAALARSPGVGLRPSAAKLLLWLMARLWVDPASTRIDNAVVLTGSDVHGPYSSPELDPNRAYVSLGSHASGGRGAPIGTPQRGGLTTLFQPWERCRDSKVFSKLIEQFAYLARPFKLTVSAHCDATGDVLTLADLQALAQSGKDLYPLARYRLRVFTSSDYPTRWSHWFARRLGFAPRRAPEGETVLCGVADRIELPSASTRVSFVYDSATVCQIDTPDPGLANAILQQALRDHGNRKELAPAETLVPVHAAAPASTGSDASSSAFLVPISLLPVADRVARQRGSRIVRVPSLLFPLAEVECRKPVPDPVGEPFLTAIARSPRGLIEWGHDPETRLALICWLVLGFPDADLLLIASADGESAAELARWLPRSSVPFREMIEGGEPYLVTANKPLRRITAAPQKLTASEIGKCGEDLLVACDAVAAARGNAPRFLTPRGDRVYGFVADLASLSADDAAAALAVFGPVVYRAGSTATGK